MRIVACADVHGAYDVVARIVRAEQDADILVIAGDLTTFGDAREAGKALEGFAAVGQRVLAVGGNMDPRAVDEELIRRGASLDGRGVVIGDIGFFGVSGAPLSPLRTPSEFAEEDLLRRAEEGWEGVRGAIRTIFVPHAPPFGTLLDTLVGGKHVGSTAVRDAVLRYRPDLTVCGHIHEARGTDVLGGATIVNVGPAFQGSYAVVTIETGVEVTLRRL